MKLKNYIGGTFCAPAEVGVLEVPNPATGERLAEVPLSAPAEVEKAVLAARKAAVEWAAVPVVERARILFRYRDLLERYKEDLAVLVTTENGKNLDDARGEVRRGIEVVEFACGIPTLMMGQTVP
ncbi:MAG: aldehyde dehydrogenase family protein, partial [Alicyclobacillus herbarius]|uniref:aldehyde dehydrogenase family protein n=1 Tax=Alicyclobacillus herbarius TaxID=122960 RepID=UPI00235774ED